MSPITLEKAIFPLDDHAEMLVIQEEHFDVVKGGSIKSVVQQGLGAEARLIMVLHPLLESRFSAALRLIGQLDFMRSSPRAIRVIEEEFV